MYNEKVKHILLTGFFKQPAKRYLVEVVVNDENEVNADAIGQALASAGLRGKVETAPKVGYNGHANYMTWLTSLWIDNDAAVCNKFQALAEVKNTYEVSQAIKEHIEREVDAIFKDATGLIYDMVSASIREVNFYELAERFVEQL
jgi:hypothetical protein